MMPEPLRFSTFTATLAADPAQRARTRYWLDARPASAMPAYGDFADCFQMDAERYGIIVGDVGGRGLAVGSAARSLLAYARDLVLHSTLPLRAIVAILDGFFSRTLESEDVPIATIFVGVADTKDGALEYASAGHEPALLFTPLKRHVHLEPTGPLLGLDGDLRADTFAQRRVTCAAGSTLAVVTDGITESRRYADEDIRFFGSSGVARAVVRAYRTQSDPARTIGTAALAHAGGCIRDDATSLVVRFGGPGRERSRAFTRPPQAAR